MPTGGREARWARLWDMASAGQSALYYRQGIDINDLDLAVDDEGLFAQRVNKPRCAGAVVVDRRACLGIE